MLPVLQSYESKDGSLTVCNGSLIRLHTTIPGPQKGSFKKFLPSGLAPCTSSPWSATLSFIRLSAMVLTGQLQSLTYALYDLCDHPEYITPLRKELEAATLEDYSAWQPENMPRLDSFLKESSRLNPSDAGKWISAQRLQVPFPSIVQQ